MVVSTFQGFKPLKGGHGFFSVDGPKYPFPWIFH